MNAENLIDESCPQRTSAEHEKYAGAQSAAPRESEAEDRADLLERILDRDNMNEAFKRVRANKGAPGIDGMTVEAALPWLIEHGKELIDSLRDGTYKPQPVRRKEIPKPDGGIRKLGIPTVIDRMIQQAITQQLTPIYEPIFSDNSYGYRPHRNAQMAIRKAKEYADEGYTVAVEIDLTKYFDTLNHDLLMNTVREEVKDKRVLELIKKYLKSGVMANGLLIKTEEGSPQGGPLSPLLANIYLNKYDHEMTRRGVKEIRYADDIVLFAKSKRAGERLLESSRRYLEKKLKLKLNSEKSKVVSTYSPRKFKFLGYALGKSRQGTFIRIHAKALKKAKEKLKELTSRSQGRKICEVFARLKRFVNGWINYFGIARIKKTLEDWDGWLRRRIRMYIWKQWKKTRRRKENLMKLGVPEWRACEAAYSRKAYWRSAKHASVHSALTNERLARAGYYSLSERYESLHLYD